MSPPLAAMKASYSAIGQMFFQICKPGISLSQCPYCLATSSITSKMLYPNYGSTRTRSYLPMGIRTRMKVATGHFNMTIQNVQL